MHLVTLTSYNQLSMVCGTYWSLLTIISSNFNIAWYYHQLLMGHFPSVHTILLMQVIQHLRSMYIP